MAVRSGTNELERRLVPKINGQTDGRTDINPVSVSRISKTEARLKKRLEIYT